MIEAIIASWLKDNAYMAYAVSLTTYKNLVAYLLAQGLTAGETESILNSKHVRWSSDTKESSGEYLHVSDFITYFEANADVINRNLKDWTDDAEWHADRIVEEYQLQMGL